MKVPPSGPPDPATHASDAPAPSEHGSRRSAGSPDAPAPRPQGSPDATAPASRAPGPPRWVGAVRSAIYVVLCLLFVASLPGSVLRTLVFERVAPPVPETIHDRDASLDVFVRTNDGQNIARARVRALAVLDGRVHSAGEGLTNAEGFVHIDRLPRAEHWVLADAPGRARGATTLVLLQGTRNVVFSLEPEHFLDIAVKDERGGAIAGAEIEITGRDPLPVGARTDEDGRVHVGRLTRGPYTATARLLGLEEVTQRGLLEGTTAHFVLRRLGVIVARVRDGGEPAAGARVQISGATLWPPRAADTDAAGIVRIASLSAGTYALRANRGDRVSPIELDVAVNGGDEREVELNLEPGITVTAHVIEGEQEGARDPIPISGARVALVEGGLSPFPLEGISDRAGQVRLGPIARGGATLSAQADGFVARGGIAVPEPMSGPVVLALSRAGTIVGRVVDTRGYPVDGATVVLFGTDFHGAPIDDDPRRTSFRDAHFTATLAGPRPLVPAGELGVMPGPVPPIPHASDPVSGGGGGGGGGGGASPSAMATAVPPSKPSEPWVTGADGTFRATPATPGRVRALVRHPQYVEAMSEMVTLPSGGEAKVTIVMRAGGSLEGRVVDARGHAVEGARVTVGAVRGTLERAARTPADGSFAFASLPESIVLTASRDDPANNASISLTLSIPEGQKREVTLTLPDPRPALRVRVTDDRGYSLDAVQLSATSLDPNAPLRSTAYTDARGEASIQGARGLPLRIEARAPERAPTVTTVEADAREPVMIALGRAESATGEVRSSRGDRIKDAEVVLYTDLGARHARTDLDGLFAVNELAPGPARLVVRAQGYAPADLRVAVAKQGGNRPTALGRVELKAEGAVSGTVVDAQNRPVQGARIARDQVPTYLAVGVTPRGIAVADAQGRFRLGELEEGTVTLEAFAPDVGRTRLEGVRVVAGRTTSGLVMAFPREGDKRESATGPESHGVAVTLSIDPDEAIVLAAVAEGSAAERAGLAPGDILLEVDGAAVHGMDEARARLNGAPALDVVLKLQRGEATRTVRLPREPIRR
ncbi:carboxypeptidase regulatory-like domain-containing protein [Pendulispora albinea]|uniref:Carboxypeptidase regulatory-like domain-containing protein n=1 Tax=Pendulispora albinea TaxID=2741071 RepID=A0ABZ2LXI2_9BACT